MTLLAIFLIEITKLVILAYIICCEIQFTGKDFHYSRGAQTAGRQTLPNTKFLLKVININT